MVGGERSGITSDRVIYAAVTDILPISYIISVALILLSPTAAAAGNACTNPPPALTISSSTAPEPQF